MYYQVSPYTTGNILDGQAANYYVDLSGELYYMPAGTQGAQAGAGYTQGAHTGVGNPEGAAVQAVKK